MIQAALATVQHVVKGAIKIIAPMTYRQRYHQSTGRDPLCCPHCQGDMSGWRLWHPPMASSMMKLLSQTRSI
jgi:hypothetical protein